MANQIVPTTAPFNAKFRGPSNSKQFNDFSRAAYNDLVTAYQALQEQLNATNLTNEILSNQYATILQALAAAEDLLNAIQTNYASLLGFGNPNALNKGASVTLVQSLFASQVSYGGFPSFFPASAPLAAQSRAVYAPEYGQIIPSLAVAPVSKAYVVDLISQQIVTPPNVASVGSPVVSPTISPFSTVSNDISAAVDGDATTYWRQNVYFSANQQISEVLTTVTLTTPEQYVNNLLCNYVTIHPYPEYGIDITSIVLYGAPGSASIQLLPVDDLGNIIPLAAAGKTRLLFPDTPVVSIDITFRQSNPNLVLTPGLQAFVTGAAVLDFGYMTFNQNPSLVLVPFSLANNFFRYVTGVGPVVNGATLSLFYVNPSGDVVPFNVGDVLPGFVQTVYVQVQLQPGSGILPVVEQIQLQYYPVYLPVQLQAGTS
jgi:hypothetical protein